MSFEYDIKKNKSICPYPWKHSYIGAFFERKLCCISDDIIELKGKKTSEVWNSDYFKKIRLNMLNGIKNDICSRCYEYEEKGIMSLREMAEEAYIYEDKEKLYKTNKDGSIDELPSYFDYREIYCNLKCISCGWTYSSTHIKLHNKRWGDNNKDNHKKIEKNYELTQDMINDIITSLRSKRCENIYWAGGEPMLSEIHWSVIEEMLKLRENEKYRDYIDYKVNMHYNSNMTIGTYKGKSIWKLLEPLQPSIQSSIDGTNETLEYCRDGADWEIVKNNWDECYNYLNKNKQMGIASVLHMPVILDIDRWFNFFEKYPDISLYNHRFIRNIDLPGAFLDVCLLPKNIFERVIDYAYFRFKKSKLKRSDISADIIKSYKLEREKYIKYYEDPKYLAMCKKNTLERDKFLNNKKSYGELLKIINKEVYDWYNDIDISILKKDY